MAFVLFEPQSDAAPTVVGGGVLRELSAYASEADCAKLEGYGPSCLALTVVVSVDLTGRSFAELVIH